MIKNILPYFITLVLLIGCFPMQKCYANESAFVVSQTCDSLDDEQTRYIINEITDNILTLYGEKYKFGIFDVYFDEVSSTSDLLTIDIDIYVEMTLIEDPRESDYIKELNQAVSQIKDIQKKNTAQQVVDNEINELMENYNNTQLTAFLYRVSCVPGDERNIELFHRVDITDDEVLVEAIDNVQSLSDNSDTNKILSKLIAKQTEATNARSISTVTYDRNAAVYYAITHAVEEPEFSKENGKGSDCANFVSYCLNFGGIPIDEEGKWYPRPDGEIWAGDNWMRTGYYDNGGVVPYMVDQGYFSETNSHDDVTVGSIVYWNNKSHVALTTYRDQNGTIKYTQHSNVKMEVVYTILKTNLDVTFFVPTN